MKRVLVCPLDWGLGHATRCVPIIKQLLNHNIQVIIGADSHPLSLLMQEFPELEFIRIQGYEISYSANGQMMMNIIKLTPKILKTIKMEHTLIDEIIKKAHIDAVISDNRFGLWTDKVPCIFITHQIRIKTPILEQVVYKANQRFIDKYTECWIPDFETENCLSGELSHRQKPSNGTFIGPVSRFEPSFEVYDQEYDVMALISGPEPQRSIFEEKVLDQLKASGLKAILVRGLTEEKINIQDGNVEIHSHLPANEMEKAILSSNLIISRSGYSTIMDLAVLGKNAVLIPTPGQTEQVYLAKYHKKLGHYYSMKQQDFNLKKALEESKNYKGLELNYDGHLLKEKIDNFASMLFAM